MNWMSVGLLLTAVLSLRLMRVAPVTAAGLSVLRTGYLREQSRFYIRYGREL